jgi:hypothetical protein
VSELTGLCPEYETLGSLEAEVAVGSWMSARSTRAEVRKRGEPGVDRRGWSEGAWVGSRAGLFLLVLVLLAAALPLAGREKDKVAYGEGLIVNIPLPESEIVPVVEEVAQNGVIRGTKEYNKDEFVSGAKAATTSQVFPAWNEGGKVFYKVREQALDPRNFKDSSDSGTLVVRYVVKPQGEKNTVLRIDALFKEDFRHIVHPSDGSVEKSEYQDIREHFEAVELMKKQNAEAEEQRQQQLVKKRNLAMQADVPAETAPQPVAQATESHEDTASVAGGTQSASESSSSQTVPGQALAGQTLSGQSLEDHVKDLRKQVERLVKSPGAPLKSAPFHTASTLQSLPTGTEVLILISTPYWYGIETHEGQHGWMMRDQLEQP